MAIWQHRSICEGKAETITTIFRDILYILRITKVRNSFMKTDC